MLVKAILGPLYLPVLQLVALLTAPVTALYAVGGLLASPVIIPAIIFKNLAVLAIFTPFLLLTLPIAIPVGFVIASILVGVCILKSFCVVLTPLLWPLWFLCAWAKATCAVSQVLVMDTIMPWLVPIRFTFLAAIAPKLLLG